MKTVLRVVALCSVFLAAAGVADDHVGGNDNVEAGGGEASAESSAPRIYKSVGKDGVPSFSSDSVDGAEEVELKPSNSVNITPTKRSKVAPAATQKERVYRVSISSPENEKHYHNDPSPVPISVSVTPALLVGYSVQVTDNGVLQDKVDGRYVLEYPNRGEHKLVASVVDEEGEVLAESEPVTIYVHRVSRLTNPQFQRPAKPTKR